MNPVNQANNLASQDPKISYLDSAYKKLDEIIE